MVTLPMTVLCVSPTGARQPWEDAWRGSPLPTISHVADDGALVTLAWRAYDAVLWCLEQNADAVPAALDTVLENFPWLPVVLLVAPQAEWLAVETLERGVVDYVLTTPPQLRRLPGLLARTITQRRGLSELRAANASLRLYERAVAAVNDGLVIADARRPGMPLVCCNPAFTRITGYPADEIVGRNCRFLQGPATDPLAVDEIRRALAAAEPCQVELLNYRRDGTPFWNELSLAPVCDADGRLSHYVGTQRDVTSRRQAEEQVQQLHHLVQRELQARQAAEALLRAAEAHYRMLVEHIPLAVSTIQLDVAGAVPYVSPQIETLLGFTPEEWLGQRDLWWRQIHPDDVASVRAAAAASGNSYAFQSEHRQLHRDGHVIWIHYDQHIITIGTHRFLIATISDISQRKQAEEALRESNERYDLAVHGSSDGIWDWRIQQDLAYFSPRFRELMGYSSETYLEGMASLAAVVHPDDHARTVAALNAHLEQRVPFKVEYRLRTVSGAYRWFLVRGQAIWDGEGRPTRMAGSLSDIHDGKLAQQELEQLNRTLEQRVAERTDELARSLKFAQSINAATPDIVYLFDLVAQRNVSSNRSIQTVLGYTSEQLQALGDAILSQLMHPDDLAQLPSQIAALQCLADGEVQQHEYRMRAASGVWRWLQSREVIFQRLPDGAPHLVLGIASDITERKQAEEALRTQSAELTRANAELARAARLKDEFLTNMSHELRTPLTSILGRAELLLEQGLGSLTDRQLHSLHSIDESGRHLLALINDILDLSKIEAGKLVIEPARFVVADLCQACLRMVAATAMQKRLTLHTALDPAVTALVNDARRLKQILVNLLGNAVKFTPEDGQVGLEVRGNAAAGQVQFTVWDTGIGIAPEHQAQLFQPFVQIDSSLTRQYEGTGLGLALVARLAAACGGSVAFSSTPGVGSRFSVTLPWAFVARVPLIEPMLPPPPSAPRTAPLILLVDDNAETLALIKEYLALHGYQLALAHNGRELFAQLLVQHPDLVVLDMQMPEVDGLTALQVLRADPALANLPVVVLSADAMPGDREQAHAAGASAYLSKPVVLAELERIVEALIIQAQKGQPA